MPRLKQQIEGKTACVYCSPHASLLPLNATLHPGFGTWDVSCSDGRVKQFPENGAEHTRLREVDEFAAAYDPDGRWDWRIQIDGPLWGGVYQRHGQGHWALIEQNEGFA